MPKAAPMSNRASAAGSKTDLMQAKPEPISDSSSAFVIAYLRREKSYCATAVKRDE